MEPWLLTENPWCLVSRITAQNGRAAQVVSFRDLCSRSVATFASYASLESVLPLPLWPPFDLWARLISCCAKSIH